MMPPTSPTTSSSERAPARWREWLLRATPLGVLLLGLLVTVFVYQQQEQSTRATARARFDREIERTRAAIQSRMGAYEDLLHNAHGLFAANESVTRDQWRGFVSALPLADRYPGMTGVGLVVEVPNKLLGPFENSMKLEGMDNFQVHPRGERDVYLPVRYIEPLANNSSALGFDLAADPAQRSAAERARDSGEPTLTPRLTLEQNGKTESGFLLLVPVYHHAMPQTTIAERRAALIAWVYAPIRVEPLMQGILGPGMPSIDLEIFDGNEPSAGDMLFNSNKSAKPSDTRATFTEKQFLVIGSRPWTLGFTTLPDFDLETNSSTPLLFGAAFALGSLLLFGLTLVLVNNQSLAEARAEQMTAAVRENELKLRGQNEFLAALQATRLGLLSQQSLDDTLRSIVTRAAELAGTHHGYLFQLEPAGDEMLMKVGTGFFAQRVGDRIKRGQSVAGVSWQNAQPLVVNDYPRWPGRVPSPVFDRLRSLAGVPLKRALSAAEGSGEQVVGVIGLGYVKGEAGRFADEDITRLAQIGELASLALENAKLFDQAATELAERKRAEAQLRQARDDLELRVIERTAELAASEEKYRTILEQIEDGYYELDLAGRVTFFNDSLMRILGYPKPQLIGLHFKQYTQPDDYDKVFNAFNSVYRTGEPVLGVGYRIHTKEGVLRYIETSATLIRDSAGQPLGFRGIVRDVTERTVAEEEILRRNQELAVVNELASAIAQQHDLEPLLETIRAQIARVMPADAFFIRLFDEATGLMIPLFDYDDGQRYHSEPSLLEAKGRSRTVLETGEPLLLNRTPEELRTFALDPNHASGNPQKVSASLMFVPLRIGERVAGVLTVQSYSLNAYEQRHLTLLNAIANYVTVAIESARLFEQTQNRAQQLSELSRMALELSSVQVGEQELLTAITDRAMQLFGVDGAGIWLPSAPDEIELKYTINVGAASMTGRRLKKGEGLSGKVFQTGRLLRVNDYLAWTGRATGFADAPFRAALAVPMLWQNEIVGVLALTHSQPDKPFGENDEQAAQLYAAQAAAALENARLFQQTQARAEEVSVINDMARIISQQLEPEQLMDTVYEQVKRLMPLDAFFISTYDEAANLLHYPVTYDLGQRYADPAAVLPPRGNTLRIIETGETVLVHKTPEQIEAELRAADNVMGSGKPAPSIVFVPLRLGNKITGVMSVQTYEYYQYSQREVTLLNSIASHVAVALENARLFKEAEARARQEYLTRSIVTQVSGSIDLNTILQTTARQLSQALGASHAIIRLGAPPANAVSKGNGGHGDGHSTTNTD